MHGVNLMGSKSFNFEETGWHFLEGGRIRLVLVLIVSDLTLLFLLFLSLSVDPCEQSDIKCGENQQCVDVKGSPKCSCKPGFVDDGSGDRCTGRCFDIHDLNSSRITSP